MNTPRFCGSSFGFCPDVGFALGSRGFLEPGYLVRDESKQRSRERKQCKQGDGWQMILHLNAQLNMGTKKPPSELNH